MCTIMNLANPRKTMENDSGFHIVKKNGQFEIVKLELVEKKIKTKLNSSSCDNKQNCHAEHCNCSECRLGSKHQILSKDDSSQPRIGNLEAKYVFPKYVSTKLTNIEKTARITVPLKTYSRVGKKNTKPTLIRLKKSESSTTQTATHLVPVQIKTEPELDIVDEVSKSDLTINWDRFLQEPELIETNVKKVSLEERLVPTGEHAFVRNKAIKIVQKVTSPTPLNNDADACPDDSLSTIPNLPLLQELAKKATKCNVCGMVFPKYHNQLIALGKHFLGHKTSVINVVKEYNSDTHSKQNKAVGTSGHNKSSPIILNNLLKKAPKPIAILIPEVKRQLSPQGKNEIGNSRIETAEAKNEIGNSRIETTNLPRILRKRKLINIKSVPHDLLQRLRSCHSDQKGGKSHVIIGSTLIKPIRPENAIKIADKGVPPASEIVSDTKRSDDMVLSDADDDIEIVEQKPELIVIDDNDELEAMFEEPI